MVKFDKLIVAVIKSVPFFFLVCIHGGAAAVKKNQITVPKVDNPTPRTRLKILKPRFLPPKSGL